MRYTVEYYHLAACFKAAGGLSWFLCSVRRGSVFFLFPPIVLGKLWGEEPTHFHVTKALECTNHRALITHSTMVVLFELFHVIIPLQQVGLA